MEQASSKDFRKFFLLVFTKELIRHSAKRDILKLQKIIELEEEKNKEKIPSSFHVVQVSPPKKIEEKRLERAMPLFKRFAMPAKKPSLFIPEPKLPAHLEYLKPVPTPTVEIDLFKINPLIKDPAVRTIESSPDEKTIVTGAMGRKSTSIVLNKDEINQIINKFSEISKIPITEGVYRVVAGNLILSAIISDVIGSKFVIRKIIAPREPLPKPAGYFPTKNNSGEQRLF